MNNELECVDIYNNKADSNIVSSMTLSKNISHLRHIHIEQNDYKYDISLDVSAEFPAYLHVYYVYTNGRIDDNYPDDVRYGTLCGCETAVTRLKSGFVHELRTNDWISGGGPL